MSERYLAIKKRHNSTVCDLLDVSFNGTKIPFTIKVDEIADKAVVESCEIDLSRSQARGLLAWLEAHLTES